MIDTKGQANLMLQSEEKAMNQYWTHRSDSYSDSNKKELNSKQRENWERELFAGIDESKQLRILDIGTGPGFFAILSALRGHKVTAVDMNVEMLHKAKENAKAVGADIRFRQVGHVLPFEPESFDLIISRNVTWTLTEPEKTLRKWSDLLAPDGVLRYFDAEWYYYLKNQKNMSQWLAGNETILKESDSYYSRAGEMEEIAKDLPMTYLDRPQWDAEFWKRCGLACTVQENMNAKVYNQEKLMQYQNYAIFLITVKKKV